MKEENRKPLWRRIVSGRNLLLAAIFAIAVAPYPVIAILSNTNNILTHQIKSLGHQPEVSKPIQTVTGGSTAGAKGDTGAQGVPGQNATDNQVQGAVSAYCFVHNSCSGPQGIPGLTGTAGSNGQDGQNGQNATDAQVSSAVAAYCAANNGCKGPQGDTGAQGQPGQNGSGPSSLTFTILGIPYTCTDTGSGNYNCTPG